MSEPPGGETLGDGRLADGAALAELPDGAGLAALAELPDGAWLAALAELPDMWPARLAALLGLVRSGPGRPGAGPRLSARAAWGRLLAGEVDPTSPRLARRCRPDPAAVVAGWARVARTTDVGRRWRAYESLGIRADAIGESGYPSILTEAPDAPYLLFARGDSGALDHPRVAIVGTRRCTVSGREIAAQFGRELAQAGVCVLSGLALGIDGAAHTGALDARAGGGAAAAPVGVVAGGLDRPYPARHRTLWERVATTGCLLSESPLGTPSEGWRFPARNRILVGLADVVVVVESHDTGGSMVTAGLAVDRGAHVLAVPGSIRSPASAGSNRLLGEGAAPACETADILAALSLAGAGAIGGAIADGGAAPSPAGDPRPPPDRRALAVLEAVDWAPTALETVLVRSGLAPAVAAGVLATLEIDGWVRGGGGWWERVGPRLPR